VQGEQKREKWEEANYTGKNPSKCQVGTHQYDPNEEENRRIHKINPKMGANIRRKAVKGKKIWGNGQKVILTSRGRGEIENEGEKRAGLETSSVTIKGGRHHPRT